MKRPVILNEYYYRRVTMQEIDKVTMETSQQPEIITNTAQPLEQLKTELITDLNQYLSTQGETVSINPFISCYNNKLELHLDHLMEETLHNSLQLAKKELNDNLIKSAKDSFAKFLYFLTLQQKATREASIEAESFLKYFLVSGSSNYHFHIEGVEYFVEFIEFIPDLVQDIKEENPRIREFKQGMLKLSDLLQNLQTELFKQNESSAEKILLQIKTVIDNTLLTNKKPVSSTDLLTIQKLQSELINEPEKSQTTVRNKVSPITVQNNPRVPHRTIERQPHPNKATGIATHRIQKSVLNQKSPAPPASTFVKQLRKLFN